MGLGRDERERMLAALGVDWRDAALAPLDAALCAYAEKLTLSPSGMSAADVDALRRAGLRDEAIHDAVQVIAYFNYINRVAEGVGTESEPEWEPRSYDGDSTR